MERSVLLLYMSPFSKNPNIHTQTNEAAVLELKKHKEGPDCILALCSELVRTSPTVHLPDGKTCTTVEYFRCIPAFGGHSGRAACSDPSAGQHGRQGAVPGDLCCWEKLRRKIPFLSTFPAACGTRRCFW